LEDALRRWGWDCTFGLLQKQGLTCDRIPQSCQQARDDHLAHRFAGPIAALALLPLIVLMLDYQESTIV
jgi:hypothetical protein